MDFRGFVLAAATADLGIEPEARPFADAVEFRMDLADDPVAQLETYEGDLPLIATNRAEWEGGDAPDDGRLETLRSAIDHPSVGAVDLELRSIETGEAAEVGRTARANGVAVIASTHDFETTPPADELSDLLERATAAGDVAKLAVTAESAGDVIPLLEATWRHTRAGNAVATMAMGEPGRHSRAICPVYGSRIGYAPLDPERATAPGQLDLETLASVIATLS